MHQSLPFRRIAWLVAGLGLAARAGCAQAANPPGQAPGRSLLRVDLLAPVAENVLYNAFSDQKLLMPLLVSYERQVAARWSLGAQGIVRNGLPKNYTHGVEALTRYYPFGAPTGGVPMGGFVAAQLGYRWISYDESDPNAGHFTRTGSRLRTSLYGGYQVVLNRSRRVAVVFSAAGGLAYWQELSTSAPPADLLLTPAPVRTGLVPDARLEAGLRF